VGELKGRRLVQLPQTISERSAAHLAQLERSANDLADFQLLARDEVSLERARSFPALESSLCPDAAFALGPLARTAAPRFDIVWNQRSDHERMYSYAGAAGHEESIIIADWLVSPSSPITRRLSTSLGVRFRKIAYERASTRMPGLYLDSMTRCFEPLARRRLRKALRLLSLGSVLITDRLHGHILAILLGIPHVLLDTQEQKIRNFYSSFTSSSKLAHLASDQDEALALARSIFNSQCS
jgi:pyruvyl transferase EpsO